MILDVDGELPELRALATHYQAKGGALWVAEASGAIVGMIAAAPLEAGTWEIARLYVARDLHGSGLGERLLDQAERLARERGAQHLALWSDTRFARAHRFYEKHSYLRSGPIRALGDRSHSIEYAFAKPLTGIVVRALGAAEAASAEPRLADILQRCVDSGASVSFLPPLAAAAARAYWRRAAVDVAQGTRLLLAAWAGGTLAGTVQLDCGTPPNQPHRAEVQKLLVLPAHRGRGIARALMRHAEQEARAARRSLLTLDTRAGDAAETLYRALGWHAAGRIPGYALDAAGRACDTVLFWKRLDAPPA